MKNKNEETTNTLEQIAILLDEQKAEVIRLVDVRRVSSYLQFFLIATSLSSLHLRKIVNEVYLYLKKSGFQTSRPNEEEISSGWAILDTGDFTVHLFSAEKREYYQLEKMWEKGVEIAFESKQVKD